jgi:ABC-2 type transport system ATP-binding protein
MAADRPSTVREAAEVVDNKPAVTSESDAVTPTTSNESSSADSESAENAAVTGEKAARSPRPRPATPRSPRTSRSTATPRGASTGARKPAAPRAPRPASSQDPSVPISIESLPPEATPAELAAAAALESAKAEGEPSGLDLLETELAEVELTVADRIGAKPRAARAPRPSQPRPTGEAARAGRKDVVESQPSLRSVEPAIRRVPSSATDEVVLSIKGLVKKFGSTTAVDGVNLEVHRGSFYGIVGPNGAGKTTTLSMITGLLRPDAGSITVADVDVWSNPVAAKNVLGVLPDRLRLFDRLTGRQLLYYSGTLRGLDNKTVRQRSDDLAAAFGLEDALGRLVTDYSAGMTKKIALAASMIHSPRVLVLDEPFESVDPVSAANVIEILQKYVQAGGTVVLSSHSMEMIQRVCDGVAIIVQGRVLAQGTVDEVRRDGTLEDRFVELAGGRKAAEGMEWLLNSSN